MATTPVITQADIDALNLAIGSPERQVTIGGKTITYRSIADMILARDTLQLVLDSQAIAGADLKPRPKRTYGYYGGRGYDTYPDGTPPFGRDFGNGE